MGLLQVHPDGLKLEDGESEFLSPIYAEEIHSREVRSPWLSSIFLPLTLLSLSLTSPNTSVSWTFSHLVRLLRVLLSSIRALPGALFLEDVSEQTGFGSNTGCTWSHCSGRSR